MRAELQQQGLQSIHEAVDDQTTLYYTNESAEQGGGRSRAAFVCSVRSKNKGDITTATVTITAATTATRVTVFSSSIQTELVTKKMALEHAPPHTHRRRGDDADYTIIRSE